MSVLAILGALIAFGLFSLAAVLLIGPGPESATRLGLFFGLSGLVITTLVGMLRADQSAKQTNGMLDERIKAAVLMAQSARRRTDPVTPAPDDPNPRSPIDA